MGCPRIKKITAKDEPNFNLDHNPDELKYEKEILANIIIPKKEISGSASDAKVPEFFEFIVKNIGNTSTQWNAGPDDVLKQYKVAYTEKELKESVSFDGK